MKRKKKTIAVLDMETRSSVPLGDAHFGDGSTHVVMLKNMEADIMLGGDLIHGHVHGGEFDLTKSTEVMEKYGRLVSALDEVWKRPRHFNVIIPKRR